MLAFADESWGSYTKKRRRIAMGKKVNLIFAGLVFIALTAFLAVDCAEAFCIYNRTDDIVIKVKQTGGQATFGVFKETINPGEHACCNWKNFDCNTEGKRDSTVAFVITYANWENDTICGISIPAGGYVEVKGKNGVYRCEAHGY
jgi:hypothetical protein